MPGGSNLTVNPSTISLGEQLTFTTDTMMVEMGINLYEDNVLVASNISTSTFTYTPQTVGTHVYYIRDMDGGSNSVTVTVNSGSSDVSWTINNKEVQSITINNKEVQSITRVSDNTILYEKSGGGQVTHDDILITANNTNVNVFVGSNTTSTVSVTNQYGYAYTLTCSSNNNNVTTTINRSTITINGISQGSSILTVVATDTMGNTGTITISVNIIKIFAPD